MKRELQLSDICSYLPYGLKISFHDRDIWTVDALALEVDYGERLVQTYQATSEYSKAILRPMSDLTKEITHKGETFVPIVKMANDIFPDDKWILECENAVMYFTEGIEDDGYTHLFYNEDEGIGMFTASPITKNGSLKWEDCPIHSDAFFKIIDWLNSHFFDYRGLIDAGLAIENTLQNNVYE